MKKYKCPACGRQYSISFIRKLMMHDTVKTKCIFCGSILATTPKWNFILWILSTLLIIILAIEILASATPQLIIATFFVVFYK